MARLGLRVASLDDTAIPVSLRTYVPLASFWGLPEDGAISDLVNAAGPEDIDELLSAIRKAPSDLETWLSGPESNSAPSNEYVVFSCMVVAYEFARLRENRQV
jgi:hypothetical protein